MMRQSYSALNTFLQNILCLSIINILLRQEKVQCKRRYSKQYKYILFYFGLDQTTRILLDQMPYDKGQVSDVIEVY